MKMYRPVGGYNLFLNFDFTLIRRGGSFKLDWCDVDKDIKLIKPQLYGRSW